MIHLGGLLLDLVLNQEKVQLGSEHYSEALRQSPECSKIIRHRKMSLEHNFCNEKAWLNFAQPVEGCIPTMEE